MACSLERNPITGELERVIAPNGADSVLYQTALEFTGDKRKALRLWAVSESKGFLRSLPTVPRSRESSTLEGFSEMYSNNSSILYDRKGDTLILQPKDDFSDSSSTDTLMRQVTDYADMYSLEMTLPRTVDPLIAESFGFERSEKGFKRIPDAERQVYEANGEPTLASVLDYLEIYRRDTEITLNPTDITEVNNMLAYLGLETSNDLLVELDKIFKDGTLDATELLKSKMFDEYTKEVILDDVVAQENLVELRDKLQNTEEVVENTYELDNDLKILSDSNQYGIPSIENPYLVEKNIKEAVSDTMTRQEFDQAMQEIEYESISEKYFMDKAFADRLYRRFRNTLKVNEVDMVEGEVVNSTEPNKLTSIEEAFDIDVFDFVGDIAFIENLDTMDWTYSQDSIRRGLESIERKGADAGLDLRGLADKMSEVSPETITDFLSTLRQLQETPSEETLSTFLESYRNFFEVQEVTSESFRTFDNLENLNENYKGRENLVKVERNVSEYSLFESDGLLKIGEENIYRRVGRIPLENIVRTFVNEAENGRFLLPEEAYGFKDITKNKERVTRNVESYIREQSKKIDVGENTFNSDVVAEMAASKLFYELPLETEVNNTLETSSELISNFEGNASDLSSSFFTQFQSDKLNSYYDNRAVYDSVYDKIELNKDGLKLKETDPISIQELRNEIMENLSESEISTLRDYAAVSRDEDIKRLMSEETFTEVTKDIERAHYQNNRYEVPQLEGEYSRIPEGVKTDKNPSNFIRIQGSLFEKMQDIGENSFYKQIETYSGRFNTLEPYIGGELFNNFAQDQLNSYISDPKEVTFTSSESKNLYSKKELEEINRREFNCI